MSESKFPIVVTDKDSTVVDIESVGRIDYDPMRVFLTSRVSPRTRHTMKQSLDRVAVILESRAEHIPWHQLDFQHTALIQSKLIAKFKPATVNVTLAAVRGVMKTAWKLNLLSLEQFTRATAWEKVRSSRLIAGHDIIPEDVLALRSFCNSEPDPYGAYCKGIFAILFGGGLRATETCDLTTDSYDKFERSVQIIRKGQKEVEISIGKSEAEDLENWISVRKTLSIPTKWLFVRVMRNGKIKPVPNTQKSLHKLCLDISIRANLSRTFSPHDCRRTFCTRLLESGIDLATVQRLMSHESPETTIRYDKRQHKTDAAARDRVKIWGNDEEKLPIKK